MESSICAEQHHQKFHHSHQLHLNKKLHREIDIPPRKLLTRRSGPSFEHPHSPSDLFMDVSSKMEESLLHKFLRSNHLDGDDDDDSDPYSSDHFRMYEFKVRKCTRSRSHDWTDCPFVHRGEKARRRDPMRYHYSGTMCPEFRRGHCERGDHCEFAHGVFECWLHPLRYRTEACKDGKNCKRKICFFAHSPGQLRILPPNESPSPSDSSPFVEKKNKNVNYCCVYCHSVADSPTSTLMGVSHMSPPLSPSPPRSPARFSLVSRYKDHLGNMDPGGFVQYRDAVSDLMTSFEAMQLNHEPTSPLVAANNLPRIDVNFDGDDHQNQYLLSPSNPSPSNPSPGGASRLSGGGNFSRNNFIVEESDNGLGGPDLGWVNDLLT